MPRLHVDEALCKGHGLCYFGWPKIYDLREDGIAVALVDEIPAELLEEARNSVEACPERALRIVG
ncbi:ferredoxin [Streptomyces sp. NPDC056817]|uniref:ferredoxin n=1 Tax=Streptomyces sp. NPDC056817 TaxID=3345950 RepID=UPI0036D09A4A